MPKFVKNAKFINIFKFFKFFKLFKVFKIFKNFKNFKNFKISKIRIIFKKCASSFQARICTVTFTTQAGTRGGPPPDPLIEE